MMTQITWKNENIHDLQDNIFLINSPLDTVCQIIGKTMNRQII